MDANSRLQEQNNLGFFALIVRFRVELLHLGLVVFLVEAIARAGTRAVACMIVARAIIGGDSLISKGVGLRGSLAIGRGGVVARRTHCAVVAALLGLHLAGCTAFFHLSLGLSLCLSLDRCRKRPFDLLLLLLLLLGRWRLGANILLGHLLAAVWPASNLVNCGRIELRVLQRSGGNWLLGSPNWSSYDWFGHACGRVRAHVA